MRKKAGEEEKLLEGKGAVEVSGEEPGVTDGQAVPDESKKTI
jgi:hypothetical protein